MNIKLLVESMNDDEKKEAYSILSAWRRDEAEKEARNIELDWWEKHYIQTGKPIDAIKHLRDRTGFDLLVCKMVVDNYRESEAEWEDRVGINK